MVVDVEVGLRGAGKRYRWGGPWVLRDVDVALAPARVVEVRGSNGSGKSTLLRLLAGATVPSRGERLASEGLTVGYAPERLAPAPPFSVAAYLRRHAGLRGLDRIDGERRAGALGERLGLGALMPERLEALSKGSLQKVVIVQALLGEPRVAVLDEPYAGLDGEAQDAVRDLIAEQAAAGRTVVFSDHRPLVAAPSVADETWLIEDGSVTTGWSVEEDVVDLAVAAEDGDAELASLLARGWHIVSFAEGRGDAPARIRARRSAGP
jgi:ABC-type multidrug transport system ATPase subunit